MAKQAVVKASYVGNSAKEVKLLAISREILNRSEKFARELENQDRLRLAKKIWSLRARSRVHLQRKMASTLAEKVLCLEIKYCESLIGAEKDCLDLVLRVTEEVIGTTLEADKNSLAARLRRGISQLIESRSVKVIVNPKDFEVVAKTEDLGPLMLEPSSEIKVGDALIETPSGWISINWRAHLNAISMKLKAALFSRRNFR